MRLSSKLTAIILAAALLAPLAGCAKIKDLFGSKGESTDTAAQTADTADSASDSAAGSDTAADTAADSADASADKGFGFSDGIGDDGYFENVKALDYVTLPEYKGITIPAADRTATDDEIEDQLSSLLSSYQTTNQITDRAVESGDMVNIDYVGSVDGVEFEGGSTGGQGTDVTAGATNYIDDFLTQIIGHMPGETFDVNVTFPDPYENNADLSGKDAVFKTTINYISETVDPELTDDFVKENLADSYGWQSADEVMEYIASTVGKRKARQFIDNYLTENAEVSSVPEEVAEYQKNAMLSYYESYASQYGVSLEDFIASGGYDSVDQLVEDQKDSLENASKIMLIVQAIAEKEEISVSESDVDEFILTEYISATEDILPQIKEYYGLGYWALEAVSDRVYTLIADSAVAE